MGGADRLALERRLGFGRGVRIAGVDEAGRGPLAGPVTAAAVILDPSASLPAVRDSKLLSPVARERLEGQIYAAVLAWSVAFVPASVVDRINVARASLHAMARAVQGLRIQPGFVLADGFAVPGLPCPQQAVVGGDRLSSSIAAASVLAKVWRDRLMVRYSHVYPGYGFERHKGYPTADHREALEALGPSPIHRRTFSGVAGFTHG